MFRDMFRNTSMTSVVLATALAAGMAGVFTLATSQPRNDLRVNRTAKEDLGFDFSSVFFNSQPIAHTGRMLNQPPAPATPRRVGSERVGNPQLQPQRANENADETQETAPPIKGCESGLSVDISTTVPLHPARCVVREGGPAHYASLR